MSRSTHTIAQIAADYNISPLTVRREIARGRLEAFRVGRQIRVTQVALDAYAANATIVPKFSS